ncbi:MAG: peptidoglycan editing factor PgeF [Amphritea sp.]
MKLIAAHWSAPVQVKAYTTTRVGGVSLPPFASMNLGDHVGDDSVAVSANRTKLAQHLGLSLPPQWLSQVHGTDLVEAQADSRVFQADACWSKQPGQACVIMTADCLPVFFTDQQASRVAVAHAGWRGLVEGVLENTLQLFPDPGQVIAWLGPAIGPDAFEVGGEVRQQFCERLAASDAAFKPSPNEGKWLANIYQLARLRLQRAGVTAITGGDHCTFSESDLFYSYRRESVTGRMASIIWIE